jgi:hypothetical protein
VTSSEYVVIEFDDVRGTAAPWVTALPVGLGGDVAATAGLSGDVDVEGQEYVKMIGPNGRSGGRCRDLVMAGSYGSDAPEREGGLWPALPLVRDRAAVARGTQDAPRPALAEINPSVRLRRLGGATAGFVVWTGE